MTSANWGRIAGQALGLGALSIALAGCGSMSMPSFGGGGSWFRSEPEQLTLQLDSRPPGAQATTSIGPGCKTPCTVQVPATESFTVSFTLDRYVPQTVPVEMVSDGAAELDESGEPKRIMGERKLSPNPVFAALEPARGKGKAPPRKQQTAASPPKAPAKRAPPPAADSAFPPPPGGSAFPSR